MVGTFSHLTWMSHGLLVVWRGSQSEAGEKTDSYEHIATEDIRWSAYCPVSRLGTDLHALDAQPGKLLLIFWDSSQTWYLPGNIHVSFPLAPHPQGALLCSLRLPQSIAHLSSWAVCSSRVEKATCPSLWPLILCFALSIEIAPQRFCEWMNPEGMLQ